MRFLASYLLAAFLFAPLTVSAQVEEDVSRLERWHPEAFVDPAKPASETPPEGSSLKLELTPEGFGVSPSAARTSDGYTLEEMDLRVRRAKIGAAISPLFVAGGVSLVTYGSLGADCWCILFCQDFERPRQCNAAIGVGVLGIVGGMAGVIASSTLLHRRKRDRDRLRRTHVGSPRRVQWDVAQSRLVF